MSKLFRFIASAFIIFLLILWYWQNKPHGPTLLPGEHVNPNYNIPVVAAVSDTECSDSTRCPTRGSDCVIRNFKVLKDTAYFFSVIYSSSDTTHRGCRACASLYRGDSLVISRMTSCPAGGQLVDSTKLSTGDYTVVVCLESCTHTQHCECGKHAKADAVVSIRRVF